MNEKILLWRKGHDAKRSFCIGLECHTPFEAAKFCGMTDINQISAEGGIIAKNKIGHEVVIFDCNGPGPMAVDITDEEKRGEDD